VNEVELAEAVTARAGQLASDVLSRLDEVQHNHAVIVDARNRPMQWLSRRQLSRLERIGGERDARLPVVGDRATLNDALDTMLVSSVGAALVTGPRDTFLGVIDVDTIMDAIGRAHDHARTAHAQGRPVGVNTGTLETVRAAAGTPGSHALPVERAGE
jgi:osmoprotectant transport system ATP-binding protein